jgi:type II secretory pathway component PulC
VDHENHSPLGVEPSPLTSPQSIQSGSTDAEPLSVSGAPKTRQVCTLFNKNGAISRAELSRQIEAGLGRWLQRVEGDRAIAKGRFQGWVIKSLHPQDPCYAKLSLRPGDIVTKVNGRGLEKPEQAFEVMEDLKTSTNLVVDYLRDGKPQTMRLEISNLSEDSI